jgi:hypothetical protein
MFAPIAAGVLSWAAISLGFFGLKMLMQERPEFVGQPMRASMAEMVQDSPWIVIRKVSDDISAIKAAQPESSDVRFDMQGRRDYRGLRTIRDMSGEFHARHLLTNAFEEPIFVLFKCPHPHTENGDDQNLLAAELRLQASATGTQENGTNAWFWSGTLLAHGSASIEVSYHVASLKGVTYRVSGHAGNQIKHLRVAFQRRDLATMRFESGDGTKRPDNELVAWERRDFLAPDFFSASIEEGRNLYASISRLLEIGPLICLLFLLAVSAVLLARQKVTAVQMLTVAVGYAFYFPLILYLSANFSFAWALVIAVMVPGVLLVNYARWLLGSRLGLVGGAIFLGLYQVFPTLAAFAGWNRGMVLLCLGVVTLAVLINLQNRALKRNAAAALAVIALFGLPFGAGGAEVQVILPAELAHRLPEPPREPTNALVAFDPAQYQVHQETTHFRVEIRAPFQVLRPGEIPVPLFGVAVHLLESHVEGSEPVPGHLVAITNRLGLFAQRAGDATLRLVYRVPIQNREGKKRAQIPVMLGPSGNLRLESTRPDLELLSGSLWSKTAADKMTVYDIGAAGEEMVTIEWRDSGSEAMLGPGMPAERSKEFYGIGLTRAQNLTIINSDGSCTHFAEFELPVSQAEEFRLKLPPKARLISISVNGAEITAPEVAEQICRLRLPSREAQQTAHRLSFRIAYPAMPLGFVGMAELTLPELFQTAATLEWVVALPNGFETQVISSGLEAQKSQPDLARFGDYGRLLQSHPHAYLAKDLAPPGTVSLTLKYRQLVTGMNEER